MRCSYISRWVPRASARAPFLRRAPSPYFEETCVRVLTPTENNRLNELIGFLGVTIAILIALALLSYSPHDPSFNVSADSPDIHAARNWIGPVGAYGADLFFQGFGYAAFLLPVGIFLLAYRWFRSEPMDSPAIKLA